MEYPEDAYGAAVQQSCQAYIDSNISDGAVSWRDVVEGMPDVPDSCKRVSVLRQFVKRHPDQYAWVAKRFSGFRKPISCVICFSCTQNSAQAPPTGSQAYLYWCDVCKLGCSDAQQFATHNRSNRHKAMLLQRAFRDGGDMYQDKGGISVSQLDEIGGLEPGITYELEATVTNNGHNERSFTCAPLPALPGVVRVPDAGPTSIMPVSWLTSKTYLVCLHSGSNLAIYCSCICMHACMHECCQCLAMGSRSSGGMTKQAGWLHCIVVCIAVIQAD